MVNLSNVLSADDSKVRQAKAGEHGKVKGETRFRADLVPLFVLQHLFPRPRVEAVA